MTQLIHARMTASITELKKSPMDTVLAGKGEPVAILNRNTPAFYCVPADMYEKLMDLVEDRELIKLAAQVDTDETVKVSINDLRARVRKGSSQEV